MLQIESNAQTIVRLIEELLSVSRTLKESWILGQLPESREVQDPTIGINDKINTVLEKVLNSTKFDEEVELDEDEEVPDSSSSDEDNGEKDQDVKIEDSQPVDEVKKDEVELKQENTGDKAESENPNDEGAVKVEYQESEQPSKDSSEVKQEEENKQENQSNNENNQVENLDIPNDEIIGISDNPNFDELDFESFGNMDQNNDDDIIMLD